MANGKSPKEASKALSDSIKQELEKFKKSTQTELTPKEAGKRVVDSIKAKINEHKDYLVQMRKAEAGEPLTKNLFGSAGQTPSDSEVGHQSGLSKGSVFDILASKKVQKGCGLGKSVFDVLASKKVQKAVRTPGEQDLIDNPIGPAGPMKKLPMGKGEVKLEQEQPSEKHSDPKTPGAVLPSDKPSEKQDAKDTGSGSQIVKGKLKKSQSPLFMKKSLKKAMGVGAASTPMAASAAPMSKDWIDKALGDLHKIDVPSKFQPSPAAAAAGVKVSPILSSIPKMKPGKGTPFGGPVGSASASTGNKTVGLGPKQEVTQMDPTQLSTVKKATMGGKDDMSRQMTSHAMDQAAKDAKNKLMPARQQSFKMPSPQEHASRASSLADFTPAGKFGKAMADLDKKMSGWGKK